MSFTADTAQKADQIGECLCQHFFFLFTHICNRRLDHFVVKEAMMLICSPAFFGKRNQHDPSVFFAACAIYITFFTRLLTAIVSVPTVTESFLATKDIFRGSSMPIASMICISLLEISLNSPVRIAFFFQCHNIMEQSNQNII